MEIFVSRDGQQFGPYTLDDVNAYLASGQLSGDDMAWYDGAADWMPLRSMEGVQAPANNPREQMPNQSAGNANAIAHVVAIGKCQEWIVGMLVLSVLLLPIALLILPFFLYKLAKATKSANAWLYSAFPIVSLLTVAIVGGLLAGREATVKRSEVWVGVVFIVLIVGFYFGNLANLLFLNHRANKVLKGFGVQVGLMGAQPDDIQRFVTGKDGGKKRNFSILFIFIVVLLLGGFCFLLSVFHYF